MTEKQDIDDLKKFRFKNSFETLWDRDERYWINLWLSQYIEKLEQKLNWTNQNEKNNPDHQ
jgi:hypothetical protein